jgi:hypothetical protein
VAWLFCLDHLVYVVLYYFHHHRGYPLPSTSSVLDFHHRERNFVPFSHSPSANLDLEGFPHRPDVVGPKMAAVGLR